MEILFHQEEGGTLPTDSNEKLAEWISSVVAHRGGQVSSINCIFCGDEYLHQLNIEYLQHDTLTDIITFPYGEFPEVSGDLFISTERVAENASLHREDYIDELHRVIIHGILHLCGQGDKTPTEATEMRRQEEWALGLRRDRG